MADKEFEQILSNERENPIQWCNAKYFKSTMPEKAGHFTQIVRKTDVESRLSLLAEIINKPIPENAKMQKPIILEERKRIIDLIEQSFKGISEAKLRKKDE